MSEWEVPSWKELADEIEELEADPLPEDGWLTSREWMRAWGIKDIKEARRRLRLLDNSGKLMHSKRKQETLNGRLQSVPVYKLKEEV